VCAFEENNVKKTFSVLKLDTYVHTPQTDGFSSLQEKLICVMLAPKWHYFKGGLGRNFEPRRKIPRVPTLAKHELIVPVGSKTRF
jgi:hypothetical protein